MPPAGAGGVTFASLTRPATRPGNAININNLDGNTVHRSAGAVTIGSTVGAAIDAINITARLVDQLQLPSATTDINGGDRHESRLNGANGAVTFTTLQIDGVGGHGPSDRRRDQRRQRHRRHDRRDQRSGRRRRQHHQRHRRGHGRRRDRPRQTPATIHRGQRP